MRDIKAIMRTCRYLGSDNNWLSTACGSVVLSQKVSAMCYQVLSTFEFLDVIVKTAISLSW